MNCLNNHTDLHKRDINIVNRESKRNIVKEGAICEKLYDRLLFDLVKNFNLFYNVN